MVQFPKGKMRIPNFSKMSTMKISPLLIIQIGVCLLWSDPIAAEPPPDLNTVTVLAESGDPYWQGVLGDIFRRGETGEINYAAAVHWSELSAAQGHPLGLYNLAVLYESGLAVPIDTVRARALYRQAMNPMRSLAESGDQRAQVNLGYLLESESGSEENLMAAIHWYEQAAQAGYSRAEFIVGYKIYHGWGYENNLTQVITWLSKAADHNYRPAQHFLGNLFSAGKDAPVDLDRAIKYHRQAERVQINQEVLPTETSPYILNGIEYPGDVIIPGLLPPNFKLEIREGSCGEACLWSIINANDFHASQLEINIQGGAPGRGLHSYELHIPLEAQGFSYQDKMRHSYILYALQLMNPLSMFGRDTTKYRQYIDETIIPELRLGHPIILGVKIYPDTHFLWDCDHFILLVGYNEETDELIFNDFNKRKRIKITQLLDKREGYSIQNRYGFKNYIVIRD